MKTITLSKALTENEPAFATIIAKGFESSPNQKCWTRTLTGPTIGLRCPNCDSIVYSRRHKLCGACGQPLPDAYKFTAEESRRLERILETERQRHRHWLAKTGDREFAIHRIEA